MKHSLRLLLLFLFVMVPTTQLPSVALAQEDEDVELLIIDDEQEDDEDEQEDDDEEHKNGIRIRFNGKELEISEEQIENFIEESGEEIEAWAERHADEWETWTTEFEFKMERWAAKTEKQWEKWADEYSEQWEEWGEKLESGKIKGAELSELVEANLEMLSEIPLGDLIEGALENSLGELDDAPFDSLDELGEILGGAIEQSLEALENEFRGEFEIDNAKRGGRRGTENLGAAVAKLQKSIELKRKQLEQGADKKLARMKLLLERKEDLDEDDVKEIVEKLKAEILEANSKELARAERKLEKQKALLEIAKGKRKRENPNLSSKDHIRESMKSMVDRKKIEEMIRRQLQNDASAKKRLAKEKRKKQDAEASEMKSLEAIYKKLKREKESLENKESEIDAMRREIRELRNELKRMKKSQYKVGRNGS